MTILATMPGKFGDILWSLPTVRLLCEFRQRELTSQQVDFMTSPKYSSILNLIQRQSYILETWTGEGWDVQETAPMTPREPPKCPCDDYDAIHHLGYHQWPTQSLPYEIRGNSALPSFDLHLDTPWITGFPCIATHPGKTCSWCEKKPNSKPVIAVGFSSEYIELKMGVLLGLVCAISNVEWRLILPPEEIGHRAWAWEALCGYVEFVEADWERSAREIAAADLFLGCLSSMWVLANAVGTPTVIMEPNSQRHNPIFWHESPRNHLVIGNDEKPTFDLNATRELVERTLSDGKAN